MRRLCLWLVWGTAVLAQSPEAGRIERNGNLATLIVDSPRPLDSAAITIAEQFGIPVNVEDPPYLYRDDLNDVTGAVVRDPHALKRVFVPKGGRLQAQFNLRPDGHPDDIRALLHALVDAANNEFSFAYRTDVDGDLFTLVPTQTRDLLGRRVQITPPLDRHVTIPFGTRSIAESANLMTAELSAQTGLHVSCCQAFVAGIPWGQTQIAFAAHDEPARSVLKRLIEASLEGRQNPYYWLLRCDPSGWCFINLQQVPVKGTPGLGFDPNATRTGS